MLPFPIDLFATQVNHGWYPAVQHLVTSSYRPSLASLTQAALLQLTVRELPAGTTAGDLINERIKRGLPANASAALPVINDHEAESAAQRLHTGDVVEIVLTCPPPLVVPELIVGEEGLLPLHIPDASQIQQLEDAVSVELNEKLRSMRSGEALSDGWVDVGMDQGASRMQVAQG